MSLLAGSCVIAPGGVVTGTGLAKAIADACMAPNPPGSTTESSLQQFCNLLAAGIVDHLVTNGVVSVTTTITSVDGALQTYGTPAGPVPTTPPVSPVPLSGTGTIA